MAGPGIEPLTLKSDTEHDGLCLVSIFAKCFILRANRDLRIYKPKLYMYRVPEFRTTLTFTNYWPLKRSADLAY